MNTPVKQKAALPDNDSLMMFLTISSFSLKITFSFVPLINITQNANITDMNTLM